SGYVPLCEDQSLERPHRPEGNQRRESVILQDDAVAAALDRKVFAKQALAAGFEPILLCPLLLLNLIRNPVIGPYLTMWMRIARTHHLPAVFENLDIVHQFHGAEPLVFRAPCVHYTFECGRLHARNSKVV